jgi:hypothetical protein
MMAWAFENVYDPGDDLQSFMQPLPGGRWKTLSNESVAGVRRFRREIRIGFPSDGTARCQGQLAEWITRTQ